MVEPRPPLRMTAAVLVVALASAAGCTAETAPVPRDPPVWVRHDLPPVAPGTRVVARDVVRCGEGWVVVGGLRHADGSTAPAAWSSPDGSAWREIPIDARSYWGRRAIVNAVACSGDRPVAVGSMSGGAHGNPRVTTFHATGEAWVDVEAPSELYGGPSAVNVGPVAAGPDGWLIVGNRVSGPAVWRGERPDRFDLVELAHLPSSRTDRSAWARHGVRHDDRWVVVGSRGVGDARRPAVWTAAADARSWTPESISGGDDHGELHRVAVLDGSPGGTLVAAGVTDDGFGVWRRLPTVFWEREGRFGARPAGVTTPREVLDLAADGDGILYAAVSDGESLQLWRSGEGSTWRRLRAPVSLNASGDRTLGVATSPTRLVVLTDDGERPALWTRRPDGR
ncbi:hypothetical protein ACJ5H2_11750 [Nocardioides sp. R1-1]|uniref:hypothetical protein n=1 Tax=Nocardioides sp. R1-1 TaxID=3383502 RepID=UPI0038D00124